MPKQPKRAETLAEREAAATVVADVVGKMPIRDYVTRESVEKPGTVRLNPDKTLIDALVEAGSIANVRPHVAPKPEKAKA